LQQHQTAQNSRASFSQQSAIEGYKVYISEFPKSAQISDMQFYYGELLYDMKRYDEATQQYRWVVENAAGSKFYSKAASNIIYSAERSLPSDQEILKRIGNSTDPIPFDSSSEGFIKATEWYLAKFPSGERAAELKFRRARLYYQHNQFDRANESFKKVVNEHPRTKYSEFSANLMLDIFNLKKDYLGLEKAGQELLQNPDFAQSKAGGEVRNVLEKSSFKRAQDLEKEGKTKESALQFEAFAAQNPRSELALSALFNAAINYEKIGDTTKSLALYQKLVNTSAASAKTYGPQVYRFLAKIYQNSSLFDESIKNYKLAIQASPNDPLVANFHYNIGLMADSQGKLTEAYQNYSQYLDLTKRNSEKKEGHYLIAKVAQKMNRKAVAIENYERFLAIGNVENSRLSEVMVALTDLYPKESENANKYKNRLQALFKRTKDLTAGEFVTQERVKELKITVAEFKKIALPRDPNLQKKAVERKIQALNKINKEINEIVSLNVSSAIVSSLYYLGDSNQHMARSILEAPLPSGLNAKEIEMYKDGIKKLADPFQQKGNDGFRLAVEKGQELEVYNQEYLLAHKIMNQVSPQTFYENEYQVFESRLVKWSVP
ncbi:MAG: tetratricopeptide repeat protein, partial [Bdellovibrionales bacterium]